jgi:polar amino acid transport system permease protein
VEYEWNFAPVLESWPVLLRGLRNTCELAVVGIIGASIFGLIFGVCRTTRGPLAWLAGAYVEIFRNTPVLVQLLLIFYLVPLYLGIKNDAFFVAALTLSLYKGTYIAEIYRSGIQSVERGQWEAAKALGMPYFLQLRYVVLPQAIRRMIPAFANRMIETFKLTTIASLVVFPELLYQTKIVAETDFRPIEAFTILAVFFAIVVLPMSYLSSRLERHLKAAE